ncbi:unnamed protein product [Orchesella dallaii]|uniref:Uncharacterized protein n=1 Tax=Orchesella dallaii TaxID=48710 RepID=A0ABP1SAD4_9HEXA
MLSEVANMDEYSMKVSHPEFTHTRTFNKELGLIFASRKELWVEMRRFTERTLRHFGFGKSNTMQSVIEAETTDLVKEFNETIKNHGGIMKIRTKFVLSLLNTLWCMVAGQRYPHDDPTLIKLMDRNFEMTKSRSFIDPFHFLLPKRIKDMFPSISKEDVRLRVYKECHDFTKILIDERKTEGMYNNSPLNYIDAFLQKIEENKGNNKSVYTEENLQAMLADLLQTGTTTTNGTMNYGVLFLTLNPKIQEKCQKEIDSVVSRHLSPTLEDIEKMPYFQACILETHRQGNVVPNPIPRFAPTDWNIKG